MITIKFANWWYGQLHEMDHLQAKSKNIYHKWLIWAGASEAVEESCTTYSVPQSSNANIIWGLKSAGPAGLDSEIKSCLAAMHTLPTTKSYVIIL